jgi:endonuclease/exonuclease/phosphatase family metal-dependent hydrolase
MADPVLRVAQLNAGSLLEPGWFERREEIVAWLDRLQPDVVCLQEIWEDDDTPNTAGWIAERLADGTLHWAFEGRPFGERLWPDPRLRFGSAVLSRWPVDAATYHSLPVINDDDPFVGSVPWELLHVQTAGLDVFSCHLAAAPRHSHHRRQQVLAIDQHIIDARGDLDATPEPGQTRPAMPPILCGDFNAEPDSDEIRFLCSLCVLDGRTAFYQDAWRVAGEGPGYTQDWRTNPIAAAINIPRKRIDYVFVGDPFQRTGSAGRVLSAQPAFHQSLTGTLASDHTGLVVDITWPDRPH